LRRMSFIAVTLIVAFVRGSNIFKCDGWLTEKVVRYKKEKQAWSAVVRQMRFLVNPYWEKTKTERESQKTVAVKPPIAQE
jgi:hypothetical protein